MYLVSFNFQNRRLDNVMNCGTAIIEGFTVDQMKRVKSLGAQFWKYKDILILYKICFFNCIGR